MTTAVLAALLSLFAHIPAPQARCIAQNRDSIAQRAEDARVALRVPPSVLLAVAFAETHLGCDPREGGNWGAPISATRRHVAGTPMHAARILARGYEHCGQNWRRAVAFFRSGLCSGGRHQRYVETISRVVRRVHGRVSEPLPAGF